jgi:hypothetical protein
MSLSSQKYGFGIRDPGSGKNLFRIPDPGVKKAPDPGSATLPSQCRGYEIDFNAEPDLAFYLNADSYGRQANAVPDLDPDPCQPLS